MKAHSIPSELSALLNQANDYHTQQDYPRTYFLYQTILTKFFAELNDEQRFACELSLFACHLFMNTQDLSTLLKQYPEIKEKYSRLQNAPFEYEMHALAKHMARLNDNLIDQAKYQLGHATSVCEYFSENPLKKTPLFSDSEINKNDIFKSMLGVDTLDNELKILNDAYQALTDSKTIYESSRQNKSAQICNTILIELYEHIADKYADFAESPNCPNVEAALLNAESFYAKLASHLSSLKKEIPLPIHLSIINMNEELAKYTGRSIYQKNIKSYIDENKVFWLSKFVKAKSERKEIQETLLSHMRFYNEFEASKKRKVEEENTAVEKQSRVEEPTVNPLVTLSEAASQITTASYPLTQSIFTPTIPTPTPVTITEDPLKKTIDNITKATNLLLKSMSHGNPSSYQMAQVLREIGRFHRKNAVKSDSNNQLKFYSLAENLYEASIALSKDTSAKKELEELHKQMNCDEKESDNRIDHLEQLFRQQKFRLFNKGFDNYLRALKNHYPTKIHDIFSNVLLSLNDNQFLSALKLTANEKLQFTSVLLDAKNILQKNKDELKSGLRIGSTH